MTRAMPDCTKPNWAAACRLSPTQTDRVANRSLTTKPCLFVGCHACLVLSPYAASFQSHRRKQSVPYSRDAKQTISQDLVEWRETDEWRGRLAADAPDSKRNRPNEKRTRGNQRSIIRHVRSLSSSEGPGRCPSQAPAAAQTPK